ncbi:hypothetical protein [Mucilaginibacter sp. KACC 22063]|uniref:hypothetical protein n=1 Tax=Mucilaginibacter sp. KACC 22063 TaxID=3025666 RepID=UPI002365F458|nr:hypothetical protein [Mucilaginibacter sp. KACC 22063]WDF53793.1 hypothetical protein PQ461_12640 [Mucilaginibacter sp. KACC 22063]
MKNQEHVKGDSNMQGDSTSNRNFTDLKEAKQQRGVSNGGGQKSFQTSGRDQVRKPKRRML